METIADFLNGRRERLGMSQARLAALTGVSLPTIQRFFSGNSANISMGTVHKITLVLGVTLEIRQKKDDQVFLREKAHEKARLLASLIQGENPAEILENRLFQELMTGPKSKIWGL